MAPTGVGATESSAKCNARRNHARHAERGVQLREQRVDARAPVADADRRYVECAAETAPMARNVPATGWPATSAITSGTPTPIVHRSAESGSTCARSMRSADEMACRQMPGGAERSAAGGGVTSGS